MRDRAEGSPTTIAIVPVPTETHVAHVMIGGRTISPITRILAAEDVPRCTNCPPSVCNASYCDDTRRLCVCQVVALREVAREDAPSYRLVVDGPEPDVRIVPDGPRIRAAQ